MNDNDIIKALECCSDAEYQCNKCTFYGKCYDGMVCEYALALINRQKAEIDRLQSENRFFRKAISCNERRWLDTVDELIAEAIKVFAKEASRDISAINPKRPSDDKEDIIEQALACVDGVRFKMLFGNGR